MENKYPTVNYIGNKEKVSNWIIECLPVKEGKVLDLFCGGCSVAYELKRNGFSVYANDALFSNYVLAKAIVENSNEILTSSDFENIHVSAEDVEKKYLEIQKVFQNIIYFENEVKELAYLLNISDQIEGYKKYLFLSLLRRSMVRKIPYSRMNIKWEEIQKFRDEEYSYAKYGRYRHYHNIPFIEHIRSNVEEYNDAVFFSDKKCKALNMDGLECLKKINVFFDVIYMDPPYPSTMNKYAEFYGPYDLMFSKESKIKIDLTNKTTFINNFSMIVKECIGKTKYIAISLNNKCYPDVNTLANSLKEYIEDYEIKTKEHVYKVTGKTNKHTNYEILLLCKMRRSSK